jgi:hypothetical protein
MVSNINYAEIGILVLGHCWSAFDFNRTTTTADDLQWWSDQLTGGLSANTALPDSITDNSTGTHDFGPRNRE